jgi:hypothetical protein
MKEFILRDQKFTMLSEHSSILLTTDCKLNCKSHMSECLLHHPVAEYVFIIYATLVHVSGPWWMPINWTIIHFLCSRYIFELFFVSLTFSAFSTRGRGRFMELITN